MQAIRRWQKGSILSILFSQSTKIGTVTGSSATCSVLFHSTPLCLEKRKNNWGSNHIRYAVRQKRAESKKALKNFLFYGGSLDDHLEERFHVEHVKWDIEDDDPFDKKCKLKASARSRNRLRRRQRKLKKQWLNEEDYEDEHPEKIFQATFGEKSYTWSSKPWKEFSFQGKRARNHHDEETEWSGRQQNHSATSFVGSYSERSILGLPARGPLKIEEVKNAFRLSALKWHPDKHQGPSQAAAEERFKCCVAAYNSLCNALSPA